VTAQLYLKCNIFMASSTTSTHLKFFVNLMSNLTVQILLSQSVHHSTLPFRSKMKLVRK
jgi:hypothetical protein